jgi:hypothetical protein
MPITTTKTITKDGHTYPYLMVNLAISPLVRDYVGGSVALKLTPYRELPNNGGFETLEEEAQSVVYFDVFETIDKGDVQLEAAVNGIMGSLQQFITDKGL